MQIDINQQFSQALELLENGTDHLFITGRAGTGKSSLLTHFRASTKKKIIVLAPTGVAALNVMGQTIHSFFGFSYKVTPEHAKREHPSDKRKSIIENLDMIIIDEASMLRADLLDCIDAALRQYGNKHQPFGGIRLVLFGDLYQIPPVLTRQEEADFYEKYESPYFFHAHAFSKIPVETFELQKIYRQQDDPVFINLLNHIRNSSIDYNQLDQLNLRCDQSYQAHQKPNEITLCTTNAVADSINEEQLNKLPALEVDLYGETKDDFGRSLPVPEKLQLKVGSQVMLLNNDPGLRWVNGSMGTITDFGWNDETETDIIHLKLTTGKEVKVFPHTWENNDYYFDNETGKVETETLGSYTQYPLRLAWAITVHKSQGKTFDNVVFDIGRGAFAPGQVYVALSRCRRLDGLVLRKPIHRRSIFTDERIEQFFGSS